MQIFLCLLKKTYTFLLRMNASAAGSLVLKKGIVRPNLMLLIDEQVECRKEFLEKDIVARSAPEAEGVPPCLVVSEGKWW